MAQPQAVIAAAKRIEDVVTAELVQWLLKVRSDEIQIFEQGNMAVYSFQDRIGQWLVDAANKKLDGKDTLESLCETAGEAIKAEKARRETQRKLVLDLDKVLAAAGMNVFDRKNLMDVAFSFAKYEVAPITRTAAVFECMMQLRRCARALLGQGGYNYATKEQVASFARSLDKVVTDDSDDAVCQRLKPLLGQFEIILAHL